MLRAVAEDLWRAGYRLTVALDERARGMVKLPPSAKVWSRPGGLREALKVARRGVDYALVIAPPMRGAHVGLVELLLDLGVEVLGPDPYRLRVAADKALSAEALLSHGVKVPRTVATGPEELVEVCEEVGYPAIVKPRHGAGCEGVAVVHGRGDAERLARSLREPLVVQELIEGVHASVSLLSNGSRAAPLSVNAQLIEWAPGPRYDGSLVPLALEEGVDEALREGVRAAEALRLRGYVGVDVVIGPRGAYIVEVNPRLTTSYVALRRVLRPSRPLGECLVEASLGDLDPSCVEFEVKGCCAAIKAYSEAELEVHPEVARRLWSARGVYAVPPLRGRLSAGSPIAMVVARGATPRGALGRARGLVEELKVSRPDKA